MILEIVFPVVIGIKFYVCISSVLEIIVLSIKITFEKAQNKKSRDERGVMETTCIAIHKTWQC